MDNSCEKVPIHLKVTLTIREAAEYSNIGINKIDQLLRQPNCPFVLYVGAKRLVKRFEIISYTRSISYLTIRGVTMDNSCEKVPIHLKVTLTIREAAEYSNIGINKIDQLLRQPNCPFVLYVGAKRLVKRKEFEEYLNKMLTI